MRCSRGRRQRRLNREVLESNANSTSTRVVFGKEAEPESLDDLPGPVRPELNFI